MYLRFKPPSVTLGSVMMARKSARALAGLAASSPASPQDQHDRQRSTAACVSTAALKVCLTCGRMITPRAKWSKNWASIKFCSDRCRNSRPGRAKVFLPSLVGAGSQQAPRADWVEKIDTLVGVVEESNDGTVGIDVEALVEATILSTAADAAKQGVRKGATLEDAESSLRRLLPSSTDESNLVWRALDSPPGLRERTRRAARRLALGITHESSTKQSLTVNTDTGKLMLFQNGNPLTTIEQLSFAKGTIHMRLPLDMS